MLEDVGKPDHFAERQVMVESVLAKTHITDGRVIESLRCVPRHCFVDEAKIEVAYRCEAVSIDGFPRETVSISDPAIVALMIEALELSPESRVLDVGCGTGYHAAVMSRIADRVYGLEIMEALAHQARITLRRLGYLNVDIKEGDGSLGWPETGPFDAINVACAVDEVPSALMEQLRVGGRMCVPIRHSPTEHEQRLVKIVKDEGRHYRQSILERVYFVPMVPLTAQVDAESSPR